MPPETFAEVKGAAAPQLAQCPNDRIRPIVLCPRPSPENAKAIACYQAIARHLALARTDELLPRESFRLTETERGHTLSTGVTTSH